MTQSILRVLVVEDSNLVGSRLSELVNSTPGMQVSSIVVTEANAVHEIRATTPDVVVLDLALKEGTGFGVLRSLGAGPRVPVIIVMTNYALPQYRTEAIHLGAKFFLDKSNEFDELPRILSRLCTSRQMVGPDGRP